MTQYAADTWRSVFFVSAGIGGLISLMALFVVPRDGEKDRSLTVDWIGGAMITSAVTLLTFALADGEGAPGGVRQTERSLSKSPVAFRPDSILPFTPSGAHRTSRLSSPSRSCSSSPFGTTSGTSSGTRRARRS